jgi:signal transduction histidine kinase
LLFRRARIRLTLWYVAVAASIVLVVGAGVYVVVEDKLRSQVDAGIRAVAARAASDVAHDLGSGAYVGGDGDIRLLSSERVYSVFVVQPPYIFGPSNVQFPDRNAVTAALQNSSDIRSVKAVDGTLRVYTLTVTWRRRQAAVVQVVRSTVPEHQSLENLLFVLLVGGGICVAVAAVGGWFLAGKSLRPVREAFERQQTFVGDASHELRTPLAVIRANAEYLQGDTPDSVELADIVSETDRLSALVEALLALARGEAGDRPPPDVLDIGVLVEQTVDSMQPLATERELELSVTASRGMHISGDRDQLRQLVVILVDNALRYTPPGGSVHVEVARLNGSVAIAITDTGIGIEHHELEKVFDRFYRADEARNRDSGGTGLGLSIARQLANEHGGRLTAESNPGRGSTFTVRLPSAEARVAKPNLRA